MLHLTMIILALAAADEDCDRRAAVAGELMMLHQSGAAPQALSAAAMATGLPDFALSLIARISAAETSTDSSARELAAFHFAAEINGECLAPGTRMS